MCPVLPLLLLAACGVDDVPLEALPGTSVVWRVDTFDPTDPAHFLDLPFPHSARWEAGRVELSGMPRPADHGPTSQLVALLADAPGASAWPTVQLRFDGPIAPAHPDDGLRGRDLSDDVFLVPLDGGKPVPVIAQVLTPDAYAAPNTLAVSPAPGFVLDPATPWILGVRRSWGDASGAPLGLPAALRRAMNDGTFLAGEGEAAAVPEDTLEDRLAAMTAEATDALRDRGVLPDDLAAVVRFHVADVVQDGARLYERIRQQHPTRVDDLALDDDGLEHERFCELRGTIRLPIFQQGTPPWDRGGLFADGPDGVPPSQGEEVAPVVIALPREEMPEDGWPFVFYGHGSDGLAAQVVDRGPVLEAEGEPAAGLGPAHVLARHGIASVGMATLLAPERLGEELDRAYLNLTNLAAYRDTWRQAQLEVGLLLDALSTLEIDPDDLEGCEGLSLPRGSEVHRFRAEGILGMGQSAGAHLITEVAAMDPRITAVAPTGSGGFWSELLAGGSRVGGPPEIFAFALATDVELTTLHPGLALLQWAWEPAEPMVFAPRLSTRPLRGHPSRDLFVIASADDGFFPEPIYDAMAVAYGVDRAGEAVWPEMDDLLEAAGLGSDLGYPVSANRARDDRTWTAVTVQWAGDGLADSHGVFAQREGPKLQYGCFFRSHLTGEAGRVVAPGDEDDPCR